MKVLFVGEGRHDIGKPEFGFQPRQARGVVFVLSRKLCSEISEASVAISWVEIIRFRPDKRRGLDHKVAGAILLSEKRFGCQATICVHDRDGESDRLEEMERGRTRGLTSAEDKHQAVCGLAIESIEAWTLGAPGAIALTLEVDEQQLRRHYKPERVEQYLETSGKAEHRPKLILRRLAGLVHKDDSAELREQVAEQTDLAELEKCCERGFKPFAQKVRQLIDPTGA